MNEQQKSAKDGISYHSNKHAQIHYRFYDPSSKQVQQTIVFLQKGLRFSHAVYRAGEEARGEREIQT